MGELQLCWMGDIVQLKQFISENIELTGEWTSPGGDKKTYSDGYTSISWRKGKKVLQIEGTEKNQIKTKLCSFICGDSDIFTKVTMASNDEEGVCHSTTSELSAEMEGVKLDITIVEREIDTNRRTIKNAEDRRNKMSGKFEEVIQQFENCKKEIYLSQNQHIVQSLPAFEYSNSVDKEDPREEKQCYEKSTSTIDLIANTGTYSKPDLPALNLTQTEEIVHSCNTKKFDIQLAEYREKHQRRQNYEEGSWCKPKPKRTCSPHNALSNKKQNSEIAIHKNRYEVLDTELEENLSPNFDDQIINYRAVNHSKYQKSNKPNHEYKTETAKCDVHSGVLLVGDSMIKHIDERKIERAFGKKATCHCYSGATVKDINNKFEGNSTYNHGYSAIVLHVGTNDLVRDDAITVANNLCRLIEVVKPFSKSIAISGIIERNDGRVPQGEVRHLNELISELCSEKNVYYIDNSDIRKDHLNGSKLHLNRNGDRMLGKNLCAYLRATKRNTFNSGEQSNFWMRSTTKTDHDWLSYLRYVHKMTRTRTGQTEKT